MKWPILSLLAAACSAGCLQAETTQEVIQSTLSPYDGPMVREVDANSLKGKVMCGYQGWFNCEGDGAQRGWVHWVKGRGAPSPGNVKVDLWPDVSELALEERFDTPLKHADGRAAQVFSSYKKPTVLRHFRWMQEQGIHGVFVQRFASGLKDPRVLRHNNTVLSHCREGANTLGRVWALMYDLSGLKAGKMGEVMGDLDTLREKLKLGADPAYLRHEGKPLVAIWGIGFNDNRQYTLEECCQLIAHAKQCGFAILLGVPTYWREQSRDAVNDPSLHEVLSLADVLSPWTVGRYRTPEQAARYAETVGKADAAWCAERKLDFLPVVFPGFSWHNMHGGPLNAIPRLQGKFFQTQIDAHIAAGATMLYVAMFDEVDEGTAIFKCTNDVPVAEGSAFVTYEGLAPDHYLKLTGKAAKRLEKIR